ncbi:hypothetical protein J1N35_029997 [Gossypium stocksii]|uniref:Uncharacterized protein n=1 Tax=Gossypium stocksii TaxID=47602 RepID=A0A9D3UYP0_9ROSI|nr:hypothetical protein J1N35_029997 [Gossypium stocksii]
MNRALAVREIQISNFTYDFSILESRGGKEKQESKLGGTRNVANQGPSNPDAIPCLSSSFNSHLALRILNRSPSLEFQSQTKP